MERSPNDVQHFKNSFWKAIVGGIAGGGAQAANILPLMWMRTIMEVQYKNGGQMVEVARQMYATGGIKRFYRGLAPAMVLAPLARCGDTAANELSLASLSETQLPLAVKTFCASVTAACFRVVILPLDTWKVNKQVHGRKGLERLIAKARLDPLALWHGSAGVLVVGVTGHFPWFLTNNYLAGNLPALDIPLGKYIRHACIGFASSMVADISCNPIRVLKLQRQTSTTRLGYMEAAQSIVTSEGITGLWGRGLKTRLLSNGLQSAIFTIIWRSIKDSF